MIWFNVLVCIISAITHLLCIRLGYQICEKQWQKKVKEAEEFMNETMLGRENYPPNNRFN